MSCLARECLIYKNANASSEDSDLPAYRQILIRVFAVCSVGSHASKACLGERRRIRSDCADVHADLSFR